MILISHMSSHDVEHFLSTFFFLFIFRSQRFQTSLPSISIPLQFFVRFRLDFKKKLWLFLFFFLLMDLPYDEIVFRPLDFETGLAIDFRRSYRFLLLAFVVFFLFFLARLLFLTIFTGARLLDWTCFLKYIRFAIIGWRYRVKWLVGLFYRQNIESVNWPQRRLAFPIDFIDFLLFFLLFFLSLFAFASRETFDDARKLCLIFFFIYFFLSPAARPNSWAPGSIDFSFSFLFFKVDSPFANGRGGVSFYCGDEIQIGTDTRFSLSLSLSLFLRQRFAFDFHANRLSLIKQDDKRTGGKHTKKQTNEPRVLSTLFFLNLEWSFPRPDEKDCVGFYCRGKTSTLTFGLQSVFVRENVHHFLFSMLSIDDRVVFFSESTSQGRLLSKIRLKRQSPSVFGPWHLDAGFSVRL